MYVSTKYYALILLRQSLPTYKALLCFTFSLQNKSEQSRLDSCTYCNHMGQIRITYVHGLRTTNEDINQRYLKNWANAAEKICFGRT